MFPDVSVAVQLTGVVPNPKVEPEGGEQLAVAPGQLSEKFGFRVAVAPLELVHCMTWGGGQVIAGDCLSCTLIVAEQLALAWSGPLSTAVRITLVSPNV
jgi:hypothetical protein